MKTPYLIQRGEFVETRENKIGIDKVISFDYMGSSEFEWGALPESLERIHKLLIIEDDHIQLNTPNSYHYFTFTISGIVFELLCKEGDAGQIQKYVDEMAYDKLRCKEPHKIDIVTGHSFIKKTEINFWWDIENDWFLWIQSNNNCNRFLDALYESQKWYLENKK
jgi:hypothetical protein